MQQLAKGVYALDLCTYLPEIKTLILADLHLGYEEAMGKQGVLVPRTQYKQMIKRLDWVLEHAVVENVILNGDVKHEFGAISKQEWREILRLIDYFQSKDINVLAIKGNHDTILGPIARTRNIREVKEFRHKDILVVHGDYVPEKLAPVIIIGHEHPAISLKEVSKTEKFKCFIKGPFRKSTLIVQPAINPLTQGTDVLQGQFLSPLITNIEKFEAFLVDDETHNVLPFGKIKKIK